MLSIFVAPSRRPLCPSFVSSPALSTSVASGQTLPLPLEATKAARAAKELSFQRASSFKKRSISHRFDDDGDDDRRRSRGTSRGDVQVRFVFSSSALALSTQCRWRLHRREIRFTLKRTAAVVIFFVFHSARFVSMLTHLFYSLSLSSSPRFSTGTTSASPTSASPTSRPPRPWPTPCARAWARAGWTRW